MQAALPRSYEMDIAVSNNPFVFFESLPVPLQLFIVLVVMMLIDTLAGVIVASREGRISSKIAWRGVSKKALTLLGVATATIIQPALAYLPGTNGTVTVIAISAVEGLYIFVEVCSVVETFGKADMQIPFITPFARRVTAAMNASVASEQRGSIVLPGETHVTHRP